MPLPTTLGRFRLRRELGRGGMGAVWLAEDPTLEREVALKLLPPEVAGDAARLARFRREARLLAAVSHPNIAVAYGLEEAEGQQVLVMEYVPGETLADLLDRGPLPPADALGLAAQVAAGLGAAHDAGLVHRDLKPANVIVGEDGRVRVLDFGLARAERARSDSDTFSGDLLTREGLVMGTPRYMSPEQARGQALDARTDVWSFGIVLFELLTGAHPFAADTDADALVALLSKAVAWERLPPGLPGSVRALLESCLDRDPQARPARLGEVGRGLERARRQLEQVAARRAPGSGPSAAPDSNASTSPGTPPTLTPEGLTPPAPTAPPRRGPLTLALLAGVALGVGAALAVGAGPGLGGGAAGGLGAGGATEPPGWQRVGEGRGLVTGARFTADHTRVVASGDGAGALGAEGGPLWLMHPSEGLTPVAGPAEARLLAATGAELLVLDTPRRWFSGARGTLVRLPAGGGAARAVREEVVDADGYEGGVGLLTVGRTLEAPAGAEWARDIEAAVRLRMARDGSAALVLDQGGRVALYRPDGTHTLLVERGATSVAWAPDGAAAWVSLPEEGGTALRPVALDGGGPGPPLARHPGDLVLLDVAPDGRMLVDLRRSRALSLVRGAQGEVRDVGLGGECVALSDDGAVALVDVAARAGEVGAGWLQPLGPGGGAGSGAVSGGLTVGGGGAGGGGAGGGGAVNGGLAAGGGGAGDAGAGGGGAVNGGLAAGGGGAGGAGAAAFGAGGAGPTAPVRLESGQVTDLAPDGSAILLVPEPGVSDHVLIVPTGAGTPRRVDLAAIAPVWTGWLGPGGAVLVVGTRPEGGVQLHLVEPGAAPRPVAEPGWGVPALARPWTPDGRRFFATAAGGVRVWSLDGEAPRDVPGVDPAKGEMPAGFAADGALYVYDRNHMPAAVWRVDPVTGARSPLFELDVPDRAGVTGVTGLRVTPDGRVACWGVTQVLSELYLSTPPAGSRPGGTPPAVSR